MRKSIKEILMTRDGNTSEEADRRIEDAQDDLHNRLEQGEMPYDLCYEHFGLEPDYLDEFI